MITEKDFNSALRWNDKEVSDQSIIPDAAMYIHMKSKQTFALAKQLAIGFVQFIEENNHAGDPEQLFELYLNQK